MNPELSSDGPLVEGLLEAKRDDGCCKLAVVLIRNGDSLSLKSVNVGISWCRCSVT